MFSRSPGWRPLSSTVIRGSLFVQGKRISQKLNVSVWTGFTWFRIGTRDFTWSSAVPPMTSSAVDEHRRCPSQRSLISTCSNRGYERIGLVTTLYQVHKFFSVWLSSVRFCLPEDTNQQRPGMGGVTDSSIGQYGALSWRADRHGWGCVPSVTLNYKLRVSQLSEIQQNSD
jgi:hypothetical protein